VEEGAAICAACDQILDESFLTGEEAAEEAPRPAPRPAAALRKRPPARPPGTGMKRGATGAQRSPGTGHERAAPERPSYDDAADEEEAAPRAPSRPANDAPYKQANWSAADYQDDGRPSAVDNEFEQSLADIRSFLEGLELGDKVALGGYAGVIFSTLLPWRDTCDVVNGLDSEIGIINSELGLISFVLAVAGVALLTIRTRSLIPSFNPLMVWTAQLGVTGANVLWCLIAFKIARGAPGECYIGNTLYSPSSPAYGLVLATLLCVTSLVGALLGLRSKQA